MPDGLPAIISMSLELVVRNSEWRDTVNISAVRRGILVNCECYKHSGGTSGFGGLEVACWPLVLKFAGSNPAEAVGFFRAKKSSARLPSKGSKAVCPMS